MYENKTAFTPSIALICYTHSEMEGAKVLKKNTNRDFYTEIHPIHDNKLGAGKPVSEEALSELLHSIKAQDQKNREFWKFNGIMPENVVHVDTCMNDGKRTIAWVMKSRVMNMFFVESLNIPDGEAVQPNLLFIAKCTSTRIDKISVYALKTGKPVHDTPIYYAPYHNVNGYGVCMGSVKFPKVTDLNDLMHKVEHLFFNSKFSHILGDNPVHGNINFLWKYTIMKAGKTFANNTLKRFTRQTVGSILTKAI